MYYFDPAIPRSPLEALQRVWAGALLTLLVLTWRLWWPGTVFAPADFPSVPLISLAAPLAAAIEIASIVGLFASLLMILMRPGVSWPPFAVVWICLSALFLTNQHRLQPWAYQGWMYGLIFATMAPIPARRSILALTISIYAYSSLGKFDQQFLHTVGPDFIAAMMPWLDRSADFSAGMLTAAAIALPTIELALAVLLAIPRTRVAAGYAALLMHAMLVLVLGPLGLRHSAAVVAWNLFLGIQAWLVFIRPAAAARLAPSAYGADKTVGSSGHWAIVRVAAGLIVTAALVLPLWERRGYWDHWLSWSLYSPHTSRVDIQIHRSATGSLPPRAADFVRPGDEQDPWYDLALNRWSLAELAVPVYPQARFQLGVAQVLSDRLGSPDAIRIKIRGVADRRTGQRSETWLIGRDQIKNEAKRYWFLPQR